MKNYDDKCWLKPMVACLVMLSAALLHAAEGDVKIGDANRLEVATSVAKLVFDTSNAPDLRQWTDERFAPTTREWVVKLAGIMASDGWTQLSATILSTTVSSGRTRPASRWRSLRQTGKPPLCHTASLRTVCCRRRVRWV